MGQSQYKSGSIYIQTDKPYYMAGETVTGHVYAQFESEFPGNKIYLKIKGYEKCEWVERLQRWEDEVQPDGTKISKSVYYHEDYEGKKDFYKHKFTLNTWQGGNISVGQYQFPFSFVLQSDLPGTFEEKGKISDYNGSEEKYKAKIIYKIKAETDVPDGWEKMKCKQELIVREPQRYQTSEKEAQMEKDVTTWCCCSQGRSKIKCYFEKNNYFPGETANIITEVDNSECGVAVKEIKAKLIKKISLHSKKRSHTFTKTLNSSYFGTVDANEKKTGDDSLRTPIDLISESKKMQPNANGKLVSCNYYLSIISDMEGVTCCSEDPAVKLPIQIIAPPLSNFGQVQAPPGWQPQIFQPQVFAFSDQNMYNNNTVMGGMTQQPQMVNQYQMNPYPQQQQQGDINIGMQPMQQQQQYNQPPPPL